MSFELTGRLIEKFETNQVSDNFRKREFVVEKEEIVGGNVFNDMVKFQLTQDRCQLLDDIQINDEIKVNFNIRGRKWVKDGKVRYFTNLEAWRIESVDKDTAQVKQDVTADNEVNDDLPF